jgi:hypothetical protein
VPISAADAVGPAFQHAKAQLLRPFRIGQWVRLAVVGLLAGELGSSNGCNFRYPLNSQHRAVHQPFGGNLPTLLTNHPALFAGIIASVVVISIGLMVLFTYINSMMRFILFDSIISRECHIRRGWAARKRPGFRLFCWQILFMLVSFAGLLIVIGIPLAYAWTAGWFAQAREHVVRLLLGGLVLLFLFFVLLTVIAVIRVMTKDFVVPQMALEDIGAMEGWRRLLVWLKADKGGYAGYIGMKIVLAIAAAVALVIVDMIALLILLIPFGGVGIIVVLAGKAAGWSWNLYTIALAVVCGCVALAILIFVFALIAVPVTVFFPAYSIHFFAQRYPPLAAVLWPQPAAPSASG